MKLIDKDALVAEVKRRRELVSDPILSGNDLMIGERNAYFNLLSFIDTLEVKEVDYRPMDKDFERDAVNFCFDNGLNTTPRIAKTIAKHFFELGMAVSNKAQKGW